ncbi:MAG: HlyD family efflux transporter periplasmic adaptor subunit [Planctomycetota bacterium]|nr:HlyD family efflux transporter periplasmic adaptor subunit [Planctomycetota bacterium]
MIKYATILLAIVGTCIGLYTVGTAYEIEKPLELSRPPVVNPFPRGIASIGTVEPRDRVIELGVPEPGLVSEVLVQVGDVVKAGQPLLRLDDRARRADLLRAHAAVQVATSEVDRWKAIPRAEDLPPLEAAVAAAQARVADLSDKQRLIADALQRGAATQRDLTSATLATDAAKADLQQAQTSLARLQAGGWKADLGVVQAQLASNQAEVDALTILIDRLTIRAPRDATVLRRNVEPGTLAALDATRPVLVLGDLSQMSIRALVDEEDLALVTKGAKAQARTRGAVQAPIDLALRRIEPYARAKTTLSGSTTERVDTRVVEVVFDIVTPPTVTIVPGQVVDVFVESPK